MFFIFYLFSVIIAILCIDSTELVSTVYVGFINDDVKTQSRKESALLILKWYKDWLNQWGDRQSFKAVHGELTGFMWVGSMVQNSGFSRNVITDFINEIQTSLMPTEIYHEFLHENALESFGVILTTRGLNWAQTAVKRCGYGSTYGESTGSKSSGRLPICYLEYAKRKVERNDEEAGECFYNVLGINQSPFGNIDEYISAYSPSSGISIAQSYCYSEGYLSNFKPTKPTNDKCVAYKVKRGESCSTVASKHYPLTVQEIESFNKKISTSTPLKKK